VCIEVDVGVGVAIGSIRIDGHSVGGCVVVRVGCVMVVVLSGWYCGFFWVLPCRGVRSGRLWSGLRLRLGFPPWFPSVLFAVVIGRGCQYVFHGSGYVLIAGKQYITCSLIRDL
jgi:hypothetical protein